MNKIYKLKFNRKTRELVVVSEIVNNTIAESNTKLGTTSESKVSSFFNSIITSSLLFTSLVSGLTFTTITQANEILGTHHQLGTVVAGTASSVTDGLVTTIKNSPNAIINWQSFNINQNEILKFVQNTADSAVLNRVVGKDVSKILGSLQSNGQVFVINPNGIIFGKNAQVNVGGLVASTLDINNKDFLNGRYVFNKDKDREIAQVLNSGVIKVNADGSLALIGGQVLNNGVLEARNGTVFLLAGNSIEIADLTNPQVSYKVTAKNKAVNLGRVFGKNAVLLGNKVLNGHDDGYFGNSFADILGASESSATKASIKADGSVVLFGGSEANTIQHSDQTDKQVLGKRNSIVDNNGIINVSTANGKAGNIQVLGDFVYTGSQSQIQAKGLDKANAGEVLVGGDATGKGGIKLAEFNLNQQNSSIDVSADKGNAGHIVFWGSHTYIDGNLNAVSNQAKGGFIETSGHAFRVGNNATIKTLSLAHNYTDKLQGTWLIDPDNFAVVGVDSDHNKIEGKQLGDSGVYYPSSTSNWYAAYSGASYDGKYTDSRADSTSYITQSQLDTNTDSSNVIQFYTRSSLYLYNISLRYGTGGNHSKSVTEIDLFESGSRNTATMIENSTIDSPNVSLFYGFSNSGTVAYTNSKNFFVANSTLNVRSLIYQNQKDGGSFDLYNTTLKAQVLTIDNQSKQADVNFTDSKIIINSTGILSEVNKHTGIFLGTDGGPGGTKQISTVNNLTLKGTTVSVEGNARAGISGSSFANFYSKGKANIDNLTVTANGAFNQFNLVADQDITIHNATIDTSNSTVNDYQQIKSNSGAVKADHLNFKGAGSGKSFSISAHNDINVSNSSLDAYTKSTGTDTYNTGNVTFNSEMGTINLSDSKIGEHTDYVTFGPVKTTVVLDNTSVKPQHIDLNTVTNVYLTNGTEFGTKEKPVEAFEKTKQIGGLLNISSGAKVYAKRVDIKTNQTLLNNGTIISTGNINISAYTTLSIKGGSVINATTGYLNITGANKNDSAFTSVVTNADSLPVTNAFDNAQLSGQIVSFNNTPDLHLINGTTVKGKEITLDASTGKITLDNASLVYNNDGTAPENAKLDNNFNINLCGTSTAELVATNSTIYNSKTGADLVIKSQGLNATFKGSNITSTGSINLNVGQGHKVEFDHTIVNSTTGSIDVNASDLRVSNGSVLTALGSNQHINLTSTKAVAVTDSNLSAYCNIYLKSKGLTLTNSNLSSVGCNVDLDATTGTVITEKLLVSTPADKNINITGTSNVITNSTLNSSNYLLNGSTTFDNSSLNSQGNSTLKFAGNSPIVNFTNGSKYLTNPGHYINISSDTPNTQVNVNASEIISQSSSSNKSSVTIDLKGANSKLDVSNSAKVGAIGSSPDAVNININGNVIVRDHAQLSSAKGDLQVNATNISVTNQANISSSQASATLNATNNATIVNSNASAAKTVIIKAINTTINASTVFATNESESQVVVLGNKSVVLENGANLTANTSISVQSNGTITATGTASNKVIINGKNGSVNITTDPSHVYDHTSATGKNTTLNNVTITGKDVTVVASDNLNTTNVDIKANTTLNLTADTINLNSKTALTSDHDIKVNATTKNTGSINANGTTFTAKDNTNLIAQKDINVSNSTFANEKDGGAGTGTGNANLVTAHGNINTNHVTFSNKGVANLTAQGSLNLNATTFNPASPLLTAKTGNITLANHTDLSSSGNLSINAAHGNVTIIKSNLSAQGNLTLIAHNNISVNAGSFIMGDKGINITTTGDGGVEVYNSNLTAANGTVSLYGTTSPVVVNNANIVAGVDFKVIADKANASIINSKFNAKNNVTITATNTTITNSIGKANNITVNATSGMNSIIGSNLAAVCGVEIEAEKDIGISNSNISGPCQLSLNTTAGNINLTKTNLSSPTGSISITAVKGNISAINSNLTSKSVDITADNNVDINHSNIAAQDQVNVTATNGNITATDSNLGSAEGKVDVKAGSNISLTNSNITGKTGVNVTATKGNITATDSNLSSVAGKVDVKAGSYISLTNSNITGNTGVNVTADHGDLTINKGALTSSQDNIKISATKGNISATDTNLSAPTGELNVKAANNVTLYHTNLTATNLTVDATNGTATINKSKFKATNNATITGGNVTITNSIGKANNITVEATKGNVSITDSNLTAVCGVEIKAMKDIGISNSNISGPCHLDLNSTTGNVDLSRSNLTSANGSVNVIATKGNITATGSNVSASNGTVDVKAGSNVSLDNTNISAKQAINVTADQGDITTTNSSLTSLEGNIKITDTKGNISSKSTNLTSSQGTVDVTANKNINFANSNITANNQVNVTATNGNITAKDSNLTSLANKVDVKAKQNISLTNSNISGNTGVTVNSTNGNITVNKGAITSPTGNVKVTADNGNISLANTNLTAPTGTLDLQVKNNLTVEKSNLSAQDLTVTATNGTVTIASSTFNAANNATITGSNVTITNSIGKANNITVDATKGNATITDSNLTAVCGVEIKAMKDIGISNSNISGSCHVVVNTTEGNVDISKSNLTSANGAVSVTAAKGNITAKGSNISAPNSSVNIKANGNVSLDNTNISAKEAVNVTADNGDIKVANSTLASKNGSVNVTATTGNISVIGSNLTASKGDVNVKAGNNVTLDHTNLTAANLTVDATKGTATIANSKFNATNNATITGGNITITNSIGKGKNITVNATNGNTDIKDSNLTATCGVDVKATKDISVVNSNISGDCHVALNSTDGNINVDKANITSANGTANVTATKGNITATGSNISAPNGTVDVKAGNNVTLNNTNISGKDAVNVTADNGDVKVANSSLVSDKGSVNVTATNGNISVIGSNLTASTGDVNVKAANNVTLDHTNLTATNLTVDATKGIATIANSTFTATNNATITGGNVTITNSIGKANNITVEATKGNVSITDSNLTAVCGVEIKAMKDIGISNSNISGPCHVAVNTTEGNVDISKSNLTSANGSVSVIATQGNITATGSNISASNGTVDVKAGNNVTLTNTNISGKNAINVTADQGDITATNSTLTVTSGSINVTATNGNITAKDTNLTALTGTVKVKASNNVTLDHTNVTAKDITVVAKNGTATLNNATFNATNNASITGGNVSITNSIGSAGKNITVNATTGKTNIIGSNLTAACAVDVNAVKDINIKNSNISGKCKVDVDSTTGDININKANISSATGAVNVTTEQGSINIIDSNLTTPSQTVTIKAKANTTINHSNLSGKNVTVASISGNTIVSNSTVTADNNITITGGNISITNSIGKAGKNITVNATTGKTDIIGSNLTAACAVDVKAIKDINIKNSNISGSCYVDVNSTSGKINIDQSNISSDNGSVGITAKDKITVANSTVIAKDNITVIGGSVDITNSVAKAHNITVNATTNNINIAGSNLTAACAVKLSANKDINLANSNLTGPCVVEINSTNGKVVAKDTNITSPKAGNISITAKNKVSLNNASVTTKGHINIVGSETEITNNSDLKASNITVTATSGDNTITDSIVNATCAVTLKAHGDVKTNNSDISGPCSVKKVNHTVIIASITPSTIIPITANPHKSNPTDLSKPSVIPTPVIPHLYPGDAVISTLDTTDNDSSPISLSKVNVFSNLGFNLSVLDEAARDPGRQSIANDITYDLAKGLPGFKLDQTCSTKVPKIIAEYKIPFMALSQAGLKLKYHLTDTDYKVLVNCKVYDPNSVAGKNQAPKTWHKLLIQHIEEFKLPLVIKYKNNIDNSNPSYQ